MKGCAQSIHRAVLLAETEWFVWLCDDHEYPDLEWFAKLRAHQVAQPHAQVIAFDPGTGHRECAPIGAARCDWYRKLYPAPVYEHYAWDNEIQEIATAQGVFAPAYHILIQDRIGSMSPELITMRSRDTARWRERQRLRLNNGRSEKPAGGLG